jgi:hypothetical protein
VSSPVPMTDEQFPAAMRPALSIRKQGALYSPARTNCQFHHGRAETVARLFASSPRIMK